MLVRQIRRRTEQTLNHGVGKRLVLVCWTHRNLVCPFAGAGVEQRLELTRNRMHVLMVSCPELSPVIVRTFEQVGQVLVSKEGNRVEVSPMNNVFDRDIAIVKAGVVVTLIGDQNVLPSAVTMRRATVRPCS